MKAASVAFRKVGKAFGSVSVLRDFELDVAPGEFLVLLGESGSGKSTALRILAGLESATSGDVLIDGRVVTQLPPRERDIAMVFQNYALYPHMTVRGNIAYPLKLRGLNARVAEPQVQRAAAMVRLDQLLDRLPAELSGGQRQRVALARALVRMPSVFLMDEPLSNLDAKLRSHMRTELQQIQAQLGLTTLYVTHDQVEAMTLAHRVAVLDKGVLQQLDTPQRIYDEPANLFVAGFLGSPPMNLLLTEWLGGALHGAGFRMPWPVPPPVGHVVVGVRPEDCEVVGVDATERGSLSLPAQLHAVENLGDHRLAVLQVGDGELLRVRVDKTFRGTGAVHLHMRPERLHLFDGNTGLRLSGAF